MDERIIHTSPPAEAERLRQEADDAESERDTLIDQFARQDLAALDDSAAGQLRRAITGSLILPSRIATATGIELEALQRFRSGEGDLSLSECERLADFLHARLTVETAPH